MNNLLKGWRQLSLVSAIRNTENYMIKLKEQISSFQAELKSKEKEFED